MKESTNLRPESMPFPCWSCRGPVGQRSLFCSTCGALQPPGVIDHFTRLGLPRGYEIDTALLDKQYFGFQRRLHPDRFASRSPKERALSQAQAVALNEAYETLKDPLKRSSYLLSLAGIEEKVEQTANDPELLMEAMEMRESLAEAETSDQICAVCNKADSDVANCQSCIAKAFATDDLAEAQRLTTRLKYLAKLASDARSKRIRTNTQGL